MYLVCVTRRNISLPDELDERARGAGLNVSALAQQAILAELDRRDRMAELDAWLDELDAVHGPPSAKAMAAAEKWVRSAVPAHSAAPVETSTLAPAKVERTPPTKKSPRGEGSSKRPTRRTTSKAS